MKKNIILIYYFYKLTIYLLNEIYYFKKTKMKLFSNNIMEREGELF